MKTNGLDIRLVPHVWSVLEKGYLNSVEALSTILQERASFKELFSGSYAMTKSALSSFEPIKAELYPFVITTEIFGEVSGKSYLLLSHEDADILSRNIPNSINPVIKNEFLKELDNILSAAVITKLSNELKAKVYGDTPVLFNDINNLPEVILNDFNGQDSAVFLSAASLEVKSEPGLGPVFLWIIDQRTLTTVMTKNPVPITISK